MAHSSLNTYHFEISLGTQLENVVRMRMFLERQQVCVCTATRSPHSKYHKER